MKPFIFKMFTGIAGAYHIILGVIGLLLPIEVTSKAFTMALGVNVALTPQLEFIAKFVSVYMLAFGLMLIILTHNPIKYRMFAYPALVLFGIRFISRIFFFTTLTTAFGMTLQRNLVGSILILIFFFGIWMTLPKKQS